MLVSLGMLCPRAQHGAAGWAHSRPARELNTSLFIPLCMRRRRRSVCWRRSPTTTFISQSKYVCTHFCWDHSICGSRRGCIHASSTGTETHAGTRGSARGLLYGTRQFCIKERLTRDDGSDGCKGKLITKPLSGDAYKEEVPRGTRHAVIPSSSQRNEGASLLQNPLVSRAALATSLCHCSLAAVPQRSFVSGMHTAAVSSSAVLPPVGFIGLGNMGYPMAAALRRRGVTLCVYDPKQERKTQQLCMRGGVGIAKTLRDLATLLRQAEMQQKTRQHQQEMLQQGQHKPQHHQHKRKQKAVSVRVPQQQQQQEKTLTVSRRESKGKIYEEVNEQGRLTTEMRSNLTTSSSQRHTQQRLRARQDASAYEGATAISADNKPTEGGEWERVVEEARPASESIVAAMEERKENEQEENEKGKADDEDEEAKELSQFSAVIICMLPEGQHVREVLLAKGGLFDALDVVDAEAAAVAAIARSHTHQQQQRQARQHHKQEQHLHLQQNGSHQQRQEEEHEKEEKKEKEDGEEENEEGEEEKHQRRELQGIKHQQQYEENDEDEEQQQLLHQSMKAKPEAIYSEEVQEENRRDSGFQGNILSPRKTLVVDCSTVGVRAAQEIAAQVEERGHRIIDAPVSGGVAGATAASLTFMASGKKEDVRAAGPLLRRMGHTIVYCGTAAGAAQAVKLCNNLVLAASMLGVAEAFRLAGGLGIDFHVLHTALLAASGRCWAVEKYNPAPGVVPLAPQSRGYRGGFSCDMAIKDLRLCQDAFMAVDLTSPVTDAAQAMYAKMSKAGHGHLDIGCAFLYND